MKKILALSCIRLGTDDDLADASALALRLLGAAPCGLDPVAGEFSQDLLVAVCLSIAYDPRQSGTLAEVLRYLVDPAWDGARQILLSFFLPGPAFKQAKAALWLEDFREKTQDLTEDRAASRLQRCHLQWGKAFSGTAEFPALKAKPDSCVVVFNQEAVAKALEMVSDLRDDKKSGVDSVLHNARANEGYRLIPNARLASVKLEAAKARFENLVEPIARLQTDLVLAAAMKPGDFHMTPLLLLGEPGIGKTFLATQLADALGVATEKISAGGAQGGFQLTGSHTSWLGARPGSLFTLLAEGGSASPVVVIDEVDKIGDHLQFPVLPVLLDLLEHNTARRFKDQFFEMEFDASRIIFVLTANSLDGIPAALLSRVEIFEVPRPEPEQRLRIIEEVTDQLCRKTRTPIAMDKSASQLLSERLDIDLRRLSRLVKEAFAMALQRGEPTASVMIPPFSGKRSIGF